jgi:ferredoxin
MKTRKIVHIDEAKCDGCGLCIPSCAEGALQIVDGKAKLVSDVYCDGLGACLGECPQGAITLVERAAEPFDEQLVRQHQEGAGQTSPDAKGAAQETPAGCRGSAVKDLRLEVIAPAAKAVRGPGSPDGERPALGNWPIQLHLVPANAPFLQNADLLLVADCVPFALGDFHTRLLRRRPVVIGCPKLDDGQAYVEKLAGILSASSVKSLTVVHMEVPCCTGLVRIAQAAIKMAGRGIPLEDVTVSIRGKIVQPGT